MEMENLEMKCQDVVELIHQALFMSLEPYMFFEDKAPSQTYPALFGFKHVLKSEKSGGKSGKSGKSTSISTETHCDMLCAGPPSPVPVLFCWVRPEVRFSTKWQRTKTLQRNRWCSVLFCHGKNLMPAARFPSCAL